MRAGAACTTRSTGPTPSRSDGEKTPVGGYDPHRGAKVIAYARQVLDDAAPLADGSHADAAGYAIADGKLAVTLKNGDTTTLA